MCWSYPCDGEVGNQLRNYLYDVELILPQYEGDSGAVLSILRRTTSGALRREINRYVEQQPEDADQVPWERLRAHIERVFLSADEEEKLRVNLEKCHQRENETLASYNRRFREYAQRAYPGTRSEDA